MLGFLAGLGLKTYAREQANQFLGPDHITASDQRVFVHADGHLFVLTHEGDTLQHLRLADLQLPVEVIDLRVMPDQEVLIATRKPARMFICNTGIPECTEVDAPLNDFISNQYKVLPDENGEYLYFTDSSGGGGLYKLRISDGSIDQLLDGLLSYPNDIQLGSDGLFRVADSGNSRVVSVRVDGEGARLAANSLEMKNEVTRGRRVWPMMLQEYGEGNWFVIQGPAGGGPSDLMLYENEKVQPKYIPVSDEIDLTDMVMLEGYLIVSDIFGVKLFSVETDTGKSAQWGDQKINEWLDVQRQQRQSFLGMEKIGFILMLAAGPLMLIAGFLGTDSKKRKKVFSQLGVAAPGEGKKPRPVLSSNYWLKRNKNMDVLFRWLLPGMGIIAVLLLGIIMFSFSVLREEVDTSKLQDIYTQFYLFAGIVIGMLPLIYLNIGSVRGQLGTDGQWVYIRFPGGKQVKALPEQVTYTRQLVHFSTYTVTIGNNQKMQLYEEGEIETYISPMLLADKKTGQFGMFMQQVKDGEYAAIYTWVYVVGVSAVAIYIMLNY